MRILYDHQIFTEQVYGGPSRYFFNIIKEISKVEKVKVCAPIYINDYLLRNNFKKIYKSKMPFRKTFEYIYLKKDANWIV